jgi:hypothetical protein
MPRKSPPKADEKPQFERFIEAARHVEAEETDAALANSIRKIATVSAHAPPATKHGAPRRTSK